MLCIALTLLSGIRRLGFRLYKPNEIIVMNEISCWKSCSILSMYENIWNQKAFARGHPKTECSGLNGSSMNESWQNLQAAYGFLLIGIWIRWRSFQKEVRVILSMLLLYSNWKYSFHLNLFTYIGQWRAHPRGPILRDQWCYQNIYYNKKKMEERRTWEEVPLGSNMQNLLI